jgi:hypothetical protein
MNENKEKILYRDDSPIVISRFIQREISQNMYKRVFGESAVADYNVYFYFDKYTIQTKGNTVLILFKKFRGTYPPEEFMRTFSQKLMRIMQSEISSNLKKYTPYKVTDLVDSTKIGFKFGKISIEHKLYFDVNRTENSQINKIKEHLKSIYNNQGSGGNINFKLNDDPYTINLNSGESLDSFVINISKSESEGRGDLKLITTNGPIIISLKGQTYRQFSGINEFLNDDEVKNFLTKLLNKTGDKSHCFSKITNPELIRRSMYGNNVNYIFIGDITLIGNNISAQTKVYKDGAIPDNVYIVSSPSNRVTKTLDGQVIQNTRVGIYDYKYLNASFEL